MATVVNTSSTAAAARYRDRPRPQQLAGGPHGLSREEVVASQRSRILQAMVETVGEGGYAETHVRDVTDRAGVSRKTFYELFPTKDDCLFAIYDEAAQCLRAVVHRAYEHGVTPRERIDAALDIILEWIDAEPEVARVCMLEVPTAGPGGRRRLTATLSWLASVMGDVLGDLDVPDAMAELIVGGIHQMVVHRLVNAPDDIPALGGDLTEVWAALEQGLV
jgi:AcrR family transcriptional regulator